jgi:hypothetical protein
MNKELVWAVPAKPIVVVRVSIHLVREEAEVYVKV